MLNCAYGKSCKRKRNHHSISLVHAEEEFWTNTEKFNVKKLKVLNNDLVAVTMRKYKKFLDQANNIGCNNTALIKNVLVWFSL